MTRRGWLHSLLAAPFLRWLPARSASGATASDPALGISIRLLKQFEKNQNEAYPQDGWAFGEHFNEGDLITFAKDPRRFVFTKGRFIADADT